jgi:ribulose-5-phosphate 4-epimerase/fuculose-1-phosphate aldolase
MDDSEILKNDLRTSSTILEWEFGDIIGHVGVRLPDNKGIAVKLLRVAQENKDEDWMMEFDFEGNKLSGTGTVPGEASIYTQLFKAKPEVNSIVHAHAPMCIVMGLAKLPISATTLMSARFGEGLPVYPLPIYVSDVEDGDALVKTIGNAPGMTINGHGIVTVGSSIDEATVNAIYMERTAKMEHAARLMGYEGVTIEHKEMLAANKAKMAGRQKNISRPTTDHSDEWRYYQRKIERGEPWNRGWT